MRTGTENLSENSTALPNRASMASPYFSSLAGVFWHCRIVVQDLGGASEHDDVDAVTLSAGYRPLAFRGLSFAAALLGKG